MSEFPDLHEKPVPRSGPDLLAGWARGPAGCRCTGPPPRSRPSATAPTRSWPPRARGRGPSSPPSARSPPTPPGPVSPRNLLHAGGIDTVDAGPTDGVDDVVAAFRAAGTPVAVLCATDALYAERAAPVVAALRDAGRPARPPRGEGPGGRARRAPVRGRRRPRRAARGVRGTRPGGDARDDPRLHRRPPRTARPRRPASTPGRPPSAAPTSRRRWDSPEGIGIRPLYTADDTARARLPRHLSGDRAVPARAVPDDVHDPAVDRAPVRGVLHRRGVERVLPAQPRRRAEGPVDRVRPGHAPRLRLRPPPGARATSAWPGWRSTRSTTCASCSTGSRSTRCRCR